MIAVIFILIWSWLVIVWASVLLAATDDVGEI